MSNYGFNRYTFVSKIEQNWQSDTFFISAYNKGLSELKEKGFTINEIDIRMNRNVLDTHGRLLQTGIKLNLKQDDSLQNNEIRFDGVKKRM